MINQNAATPAPTTEETTTEKAWLEWAEKAAAEWNAEPPPETV